jgi:3-dehydroquinate dehydratase/shikimate dehydrogenase
MHEIRLDVFKEIPKGIGSESLVTLCDRDAGDIPAGFNGLVDVGYRDMDIPFRRIKSLHDFERTPRSDEIVAALSEGDQEISKGAFIASSFDDLYQILDASRRLDRKHVLLGMGAIGEVTRIRQRCLKNEFTFGYEGVSTAPGQLSADEMEALGDDCVLVGLTGHPLGHSKSPAMQNAAIRKAGINGKYLLFDSPGLDHVEDVIRGYDIRGMNVTVPYKQQIIPHLDDVSGPAEAIGAVNTVINDGGRLLGDNTDIAGIAYALRDVELKGAKALIMGSGGAARAAAYTLGRAGCEVGICGRNQITVSEICRDLGAERHEGGLKTVDLLVNCTPIGLFDGEYPADINDLRKETVVFDMVYGRETPVLALARTRGCTAMDGTDMLLGQGAESFRRWFGKEPDTDAMREALG